MRGINLGFIQFVLFFLSLFILMIPKANLYKLGKPCKYLSHALSTIVDLHIVDICILLWSGIQYDLQQR